MQAGTRVLFRDARGQIIGGGGSSHSTSHDADVCAFMSSLHFTMRVLLNTQGTLTVVINGEEGRTITVS